MKQRTVAIIDDQYIIRLILTEVIQQIGNDVKIESFSDSTKGFEWLKSNKVDLILLDYVMDNMSGHEILKKIKSDPSLSKIPVMIMTADMDKSTMYQFLEDGAADFLVKPLDYHECMLRCKNLLDLSIISVN